MTVTAKKSYRAGHITIVSELDVSPGFGNNSAYIRSRASLPTTEARALAQSIIDLADKEDAKVAKKAAEEARRKAWSDREVAAGRMKVFSFRKFE